MGLLDPQTSDGRVIFFLPWQQATMAGMSILSVAIISCIGLLPVFILS